MTSAAGQAGSRVGVVAKQQDWSDAGDRQLNIVAPPPTVPGGIVRSHLRVHRTDVLILDLFPPRKALRLIG